MNCAALASKSVHRSDNPSEVERVAPRLNAVCYLVVLDVFETVVYGLAMV
jgi:hypothetical protein